jgi:hypothetical protein
MNATITSKLKDTRINFRKNDTISHIQPITIDLEKRDASQPSTLERIISKHDKTITEKFFQQGQIRKNRLDKTFYRFEPIDAPATERLVISK